jgi:ABC-type multidrug transport system fused ATPase/permease subunit
LSILAIPIDVSVANFTHIAQSIDRKSKIDSLSTAGEAFPPDFDGINFEGVSFAYESRPDDTVLKRFSLRIPKNKVWYMYYERQWRVCAAM